MTRSRSAWVSAGIVSVAMAAGVVVAAVGPAHARVVKRYPYTLVDTGTFGGPSSFLDLPGVPITSHRVLLGQADIPTRDIDYPRCPLGCADRYIQHAAAWHDGRPTDLGALPGQNTSAISEQNDRGVGVGFSEDGLTDPFSKEAASVAVMFENGKVINLGALPDGYESTAQNIDNAGQIAGFSSNGIRDQYACNIFGETPPCGWTTQVRAVIWRNGVIRDLGTLGGPDANIAAQNDQGEIAGESYTSDTPSPTTSKPPLAPFLWRNGHMINLGTFGGTSGQANWLNDSGEVVGQSNLAGDGTYNAFLWNGRRMIDLTPRAAKAAATWINERGDVTGYTCATLTSGCNPFLWRHGKLTDLPNLGAPIYVASVNDLDEVVGELLNANFEPSIATLWANGHAYNLNKLIAPSSLRLNGTEYINDHGEIVGEGTLPNGDKRVFLLTRNPTVPLPNK
jgi:probable HAF family extracellular repeat protein